MAYTETPADADRMERDTLPIESALAAGLLLIFGKISDDFVRLYNLDGTVVDAAGYEKAITEELRRAYKATNAKIGGKVTDHILQNPQDGLSQAVRTLADQAGVTFAEQVQQIIDDTEEALAELYQARLNFSVPEITTTTNDRLRAYVQSSEEALAGAPRPVISQNAANAFDELSKSRADFIGQNEVTSISSGIRQTEVDTLDGSIAPLEAQGLVKKLFYKEWVTRGDDVVRPGHREADGQLRPSDDPFDVMGDKLQYPRDVSLGARPGNTINCRCESVRSLDVEMD